ncbi:hypothetical protein BH10PSE3_BH10PSE3_32660 [soil metagenome]
MRLGGKFTIGRKGYWIATAVLVALQWFGPKSLGVALLAPWIMLYVARLRDAGRSALHLLHLAAMVVLIIIPLAIAPQSYWAYAAAVPVSRTPSMRDTIVFMVCMAGAVVYYLAFSIWLGCIRIKTRTDPATLAEAFS